MAHRNTQFTSQIADTGMDWQGRSHVQPEPCIVFGNVPNYPLPLHPVVPAPANQGTYSFQPVPDRHGSALLYRMPQLNGIPLPHSALNLDLAVGAPSGHYNPYLEPLSGNYGCSITYIDSMRGSSKIKDLEGAPGNFQHHNPSAGPSSSVHHVMAPEPDINVMDPASFPPLGIIDPTPMVASGSQRTLRNRLGMIGHESVSTHNASHLVPGNYAVPPVNYPGNPWLNVHFGANSSNMNSTFARTHVPSYAHAGVLRPAIEAGNINPHGFQVTAGSSSCGFLPPSLPQGHSNHHRPLSPIQGAGANVNFSGQAAMPSPAGIGSFPGPRPTFLVPAQQTGFPLYQPHHRGFIPDSSEFASLDVAGYHEAGNYTDQHQDMRLDIDHMSYEELLALEEQIGSVGTGLTEEFIQNHLKVRYFSLSVAEADLEEAPCSDELVNFCVICQCGYENEDPVGTLGCGHEYHSECVKKWLVMKNSCPICKSAALTQPSSAKHL
ncbi:probable E3 ubiquitin-protein ligase ZFP1 isoform X2 [Andrographis paniculata]|uniref:probable E3 ubiquitin-protein ligase ZFP1 isoform X2 n=1 Tax=Andrographis paniculata TaxID=175694 RepID=UPI0021E98D26|nr:probable E3 ubiquitin-protein ligase ZFP1 isoform X2 [Andrographis paniculata]